MADKQEAASKEKPPTDSERIEALESAVHGLQIKHGNQAKQIEALESVNETRLRRHGHLD